MEALGYWIPTGGPAKKRRRLVYLLRHESRYEAYRNWVSFSNDREWERVLDKPEFQGMLGKKPESIFLEEKAYSGLRDVAIEQSGGVYELRKYEGDASALGDWLNGYLKPLLSKHGVREVGSWVPFDEPGSANTIISLLYHRDREEADAAWKKIRADPVWTQGSDRRKARGDVPPREPEVIFLRALGFSPLK